MKHLLLGFFLLLGSAAWAQSSVPKELTYSRIIILDSAGVVPPGKVWKVESYLSSFQPTQNDFFLLNGKICYSRLFQITQTWNGVTSSSTNVASTSSSQLLAFPFWVPAGSSISPRQDNGLFTGQFSIIEFDEK